MAFIVLKHLIVLKDIFKFILINGIQSGWCSFLSLLRTRVEPGKPFNSRIEITKPNDSIPCLIDFHQFFIFTEFFSIVLIQDKLVANLDDLLVSFITVFLMSLEMTIDKKSSFLCNVHTDANRSFICYDTKMAQNQRVCPNI